MALKYSVTHNGNTWNSTTDLASIPLSNGSVTDSITTASTRTLNCAGKYMPNNLVIGAKTLNCAGKIMTTDVGIRVENAFTGRFVAAGKKSSDEGQICYSSDGVSWTECNPPEGFECFPVFYDIIYAVIDNVGVYLAIGHGYLFESLDGITWVPRTGTTVEQKSIAYWNGIFVTVGGSYIYISYDGYSWNRIRYASGITFKKVIFDYASSRFIVSNSTNGSVWVSSDALSWISLTYSSSSKARTYAMTPCNKGVMLEMYATSGNAYLLPVGSTSFVNKGVSNPINSNTRSMAYSNSDDKFVVVGWTSPYAYYSINGANWTSMSGISSGTPYAVAFGNDRFVTVGYSGETYYWMPSSGSIQWTAMSGVPSTDYYYYCICYGTL